MAYEADKVVVELIAKTDGFDGNIKSTAATFDQSMNKIEASAGRAEKAHGKLTLASNNNRIAMLEFQHIARGTADQLAAGAPITQVLAQHMGMLSQAVSLAGGTFGRFASFLGGPYGIALTLASVLIAKLVLGHKSETESVGDLVEKLKEHAEKTQLSEQADRLWAQTIDALIERQQKLNEALGKRLEVQAAVDVTDLERQKADLAVKQKDLDSEKDRLKQLQQSLAKAKTEPGPGAGQFGATVSTNQGVIQSIERQIQLSQEKITKLQTALGKLRTGIQESSILVGQAEGAALAEAAARATRFTELETDALTKVFTALKLGKNDVATATGAFDEFTKAISDAAGVDVPFDADTAKVNDLGRSLLHHKITVSDFATEIKKLAKALEDQVEAAKEAAKINPVEQFKRAVVGAEGVGPNRLGSSAAGFGQFMPSTWLSYFNKLFPDKADLGEAAKLAYRNVRSVAEAVIDKATDDYKAVLKDAGQKLTAANLYTVHLLGAPDAKKFFGAAPGAQTSSVLGKDVLAGNPFLKGTVAQASAAIAKRIGDSSAAVSQGAAAIAQLLQQEKERAARYLAEKDGAEEQVIEARKGLAKTAEDIWAFETAANIATHKHTEDQLAAQEEAGRLLPQEAVELKKINDERAKYRQQLVDQRLREAQFRENEANIQRGRDFQTASYEAEGELLQAQEGLVRTAKERHQIEDRLIDLQFAEEKLKNQYVIDWAERVKANKDATEQEKADAALAEEIAKMHQGTLPGRQAAAHGQNDQQNASPLQTFFQSIPSTAAEINDALESIATHGLQNFNDALTDAIVHFTSLGDVGRAVLQSLESDLIKLALQLIEQHTIGALLGTAAIGVTTAQAAAAAAAWAGPAALASLATLGANAGPASAALASTVALAFALGSPKAEGGLITGPGSDRSDNILTPTSPGEFVFRARAARGIGYGLLAEMNRTGQIPRMADGGIIRPANESAALPGRHGGFSGAHLRELRGIVSDAVRAMPGISLHPTLHPVHALDAALSSRAGQRVMFDFFGQNGTAIKTQLNRPGS